jgi:SAM-dependent MidA family methyltransferase
MALPSPSADALAHSERVGARIRSEIAASSGWISFARYMELALYAPGLGYYMAGAGKLGRSGDFTTAPELTPLFGQTLAQQIRQLIEAGCDEVLEVGAGSGALAADLLQELERANALPRRYLILELSADLRQRSRDRLAARVPHLMERVAWLNVLPPEFEGVVIGNEVLDAMPVHVVRGGERIDEGGVATAGQGFVWAWQPAQGELAAKAAALALPQDYVTEIGLMASAFVASVARMLTRGVVLFLDYGFPAHEFYHAQRARGTLMCHYRHQAHDDPFFLPGLQDITAHVDFSAVSTAARSAGLDVVGYSNQAQFLVNCGITALLERHSHDVANYAPLAGAANTLLSPEEMGELFKVAAFGRGVPDTLMGFSRGDRRASL